MFGERIKNKQTEICGRWKVCANVCFSATWAARLKTLGIFKCESSPRIIRPLHSVDACALPGRGCVEYISLSLSLILERGAVPASPQTAAASILGLLSHSQAGSSHITCRRQHRICKKGINLQNATQMRAVAAWLASTQRSCLQSGFSLLPAAGLFYRSKINASSRALSPSLLFR
jgi:hypothetical protein